MNSITTFRNLDVYQLAFQLQQTVFSESKNWPRDETYALTGQSRRSSRSIGANIAEAWAKRRYPAHFLSKLTDADGELQETTHWLLTATACGYLEVSTERELAGMCSEIGGMIGAMMAKHDKFCLR